MLKTVLLPQLELSMESLVVVKWLVKVGDFVQANQQILEVETQKALVPVISSHTGYVRILFVHEGDSVGGRAPLCLLTDIVDEALEVGEAAVPASSKSMGESSPLLKESALLPQSPPGKSSVPTIPAAPAARKLARDLGIDLAKVKGSGPGGRITVEDVRAVRDNPAGSVGAGSMPTRASPMPAEKLSKDLE